jgi:hypothetical protein
MSTLIQNVLQVMPSPVWYLIVSGLFFIVLTLLILIACVPHAGERLAAFMQKLYALRHAPQTKSLVENEEIEREESGGVMDTENHLDNEKSLSVDVDELADDPDHPFLGLLPIICWRNLTNCTHFRRGK